MSDEYTPLSAKELHEHAIAMALEAWDATWKVPAWMPVAAGSRADFERAAVRGARADFECRVRERLAQSSTVYDAELHLAREHARDAWRALAELLDALAVTERPTSAIAKARAALATRTE